MSKELGHLYVFADFCLDTVERVLLCNGRPVPLTPKAFETLLFLVKRSGHIVGKDELLKEIWPETFVEEATLAQNVFTLRKALGQGRGQQLYIETVPRRGYRFVASVRELSAEDDVLVLEKHTRTQSLIEELETFTASDEAENAGAGNGASNSNGENQAANKSARELPARPATEIPATAPASRPWNFINRGINKALLLAVLIPSIAVVALVIGVKKFGGQKQPAANPVSSFQSMRISSLTTSGKVWSATVSPDGKYLAYVVVEAGQQSLWVRQIATTSNLQIVPPEESTYHGLTFSPDGNHIFYTLYKNNSNIAALYQVSVLGGAARLVINDIDSPVSFSPDGKRLAFLRGYIRAKSRETALMVAGVDGSGERRVSTRKGADYYSVGGPAWSPDGKTIACASGTVQNVQSVSIVGINVEDGQERKLSTQNWGFVDRLAWLPDGSGLIITAETAEQEEALQIWHISYPGGEARRITNDLNSYDGISLSADGTTLVSLQADQLTSLWIAPRSAIERGESLSDVASGRFGMVAAPSWTIDNKIVCSLSTSGNTDIWIMDRNGADRKQLTFNPRSDVFPTVSPDGKLIAFLSVQTGSMQLWTMNIDGSNQKRLTEGGNKGRPRWSPDGKWIVYTLFGASSNDTPTAWKIPAEGGEPVQLTDKYSLHPAVSPDGKLIACYYWNERASRSTIAIFNFEGGEPVRVLDTPPLSLHRSLQWTADGRALELIQPLTDVSNIWRIPVEGGKLEPVTNFQSGLIGDFTWSPDGKQLVYTRAIVNKDAVLIRNFR